MDIPNRLLLLVMMVVFMLPIVSSLESYNQSGTTDGLYQGGTGIFNENLKTDSITSRTLTDIKNFPMVADLDGDGDNEIVVIDSDNVRIFDQKTLSIVDSYDFGASERVSNMQIFDVDNNGFPDIIFAREASERIEFIEYNGTDVINKTLIWSQLTHINGDTMLHCGDVQNCLFVYSAWEDETATGIVNIAGFNTTTIRDETELDSSVSNNFCFPKVRSIAYGDLDNIGTDEYVFSFMQFIGGTTNEILYLFSIGVDSGLNITIKDSATYTDIDGRGIDAFFVANQPRCDEAHVISGENYFLEDFYTSAIMDDFDGSAGNGQEIVVGVAVDFNTANTNAEYVMALFDSDLDLDDDFPEVFNADGNILSNPMKANVFGDTGNTDFCMVGQGRGFIDITCASAQTGNVFSTLEFKSNTADFNITEAHRNQEILSHAVQMSGQQIDVGEGSINTNEFLTTFGVYRLNDATFNGSVFIKTADRIYESSLDNLACIPVDYNKEGSEDLVCNDNDQLFYIDDGLSNQPAEITSYTFKPCPIDSIIKNGTTMQVLVEVTDQNDAVLGQDLVSSRVTMYKDDDNEFSAQTGNTSSGSTHTYSFLINKTIVGSKINLEGWDVENPNTIDEITIEPFTVAVNGLSFGDNECTVTVEAQAVTAPTIQDVEGNELTNTSSNRAMVALSNQTGQPALILWLFIMFGVSVGILGAMFKGKREYPVTTMLSVVGLVNVFLFIVGVVNGWIPFAMAVVLALFLIFFMGLFIFVRVTGTSGGTA